MENYETQIPENENQTGNILDSQEPMEKDDIINAEQFQVGRSADDETGTQDDSEYAPEEKQFADGKATELADEFDAPDPEEFDDDETEEDSDTFDDDETALDDDLATEDDIDVLDDDLDVEDDKDLNEEFK